MEKNEHTAIFNEFYFCWTFVYVFYFFDFKTYSLSLFKKDNLWVWQFYKCLWWFFHHTDIYLSQNLIANGHFEVLNAYETQLDQKLQDKTKKNSVLIFQFWKKKYWKFTAHKWPFFDHFGSFFCQLPENLSQIWGPDSHFEVLILIGSKSMS